MSKKAKIKKKKNTSLIPVKKQETSLVVVEKKKMSLANICHKKIFKKVVKTMSLALLGDRKSTRLNSSH